MNFELCERIRGMLFDEWHKLYKEENMGALPSAYDIELGMRSISPKLYDLVQGYLNA